MPSERDREMARDFYIQSMADGTMGSGQLSDLAILLAQARQEEREAMAEEVARRHLMAAAKGDLTGILVLHGVAAWLKTRGGE